MRHRTNDSWDPRDLESLEERGSDTAPQLHRASRTQSGADARPESNFGTPSLLENSNRLAQRDEVRESLSPGMAIYRQRLAELRSQNHRDLRLPSDQRYDQYFDAPLNSHDSLETKDDRFPEDPGPGASRGNTSYPSRDPSFDLPQIIDERDDRSEDLNFSSEPQLHRQRQGTSHSRSPRSSQARPQAHPQGRGGPSRPPIEDERQRLARMQKKRNRRRTWMVSLMTVTALLLTLLLVRMFTTQVSTKPKLGVIQYGAVGDNYKAHGLVVRDETLVRAPQDGEFHALTPEGQRVSKGTPVALLMNESDEAVFESIRSLDRKIAQRRLSVMEERNFGGAEQIYVAGDAAMHDIINALRHATQDGRLDEVDNLVLTLETMMKERNHKLDAISFGDPVLADLSNEKQLYEAESMSKSLRVVAPTAGLVSFHPDELAQELNPEELKDLDYRDFKDWMAKADRNIEIVSQVEKGDPLLSVHAGTNHYLVLQVDGVKSTDIPDGIPVDVRFSDDSMILEKCKIERITPNEDGVLILLSTNREQEMLLGSRAIDVSLLLSSEQGLMVPKSALVYEDRETVGMADLYLVSGGFIECERVRVLMSDDEYALIESLQEDTKIRSGVMFVENPESVEEGESIA